MTLKSLVEQNPPGTGATSLIVTDAPTNLVKIPGAHIYIEDDPNLMEQLALYIDNNTSKELLETLRMQGRLGSLTKLRKFLRARIGFKFRRSGEPRL